MIRRLAVRLIFTAGALLLAAGCAYYNTFYHARQEYEEAERARAQAPADRKNSVGLDRYEKAMKKCAKVIVEYPNSRWVDDALLLMGRCFYAKGDYLAALRKFDELLLYYEKSDLAREARFERARALVALDRHEEAVPVLQTFREGKKDDLRKEALYLLAIVEYRRENYAGAASGFEEYLKQSGGGADRDEVLALLGDAHRRAGNGPAARRAFAERLDNPLLKGEERLKTSLDLADVLAEEGKYDEAYRSLDDALGEVESQTDSLRVDYHRGKAILAEGRTDEGVEFLRNALEGAGASDAAGSIAYLLGETYLNVYDNKDSAAAAFRKAVSLPGDEAAKAEAERKARYLGDYLDLLNEYAAEGADTARVQFLLGENDLFFFHRPDSALARFRVVSDLFPESSYAPIALAARAYALDTEGKGGAGRDSLLGELVRRYPKSEQAAEFIDRGEVLVDPESLDVWIALYEEAHPEPDSAAADSASAESTVAPAWEGSLVADEADTLGPLEGPPAPLRTWKRVRPDYPLLSPGEGRVEGRVEVEVEVTGAGRVVDARILRSSEKIFEGPALAAAYQCRFIPERIEETRTTSLEFEFRPGP